MSETNADLLTNASLLLERYRGEERALELELTERQIRLEGVREVIAALTGARRDGRRRKPWVVAQPEPENAA